MKNFLIALSVPFILTGCGGGGDVATSTVALSQPTTYTISTDLSAVSYPVSFTNSTQLLTTSNPCNLNLPNVTIPKEWMGNFPLPTIKNAPLQRNLVRGVSLKDIMLHDNPGFILDSGCTGNLQAELSKTFNRLKALGVEQITIPQWHWLTKDISNNWYISKAEDTYGSLIDSDLAHLVNVAHSVGIKVIVLNQVQAMIDSPAGTPYIPTQTHVNRVKWFDAFRPFMTERSSFFQSIGVDGIEVGCGACIFSDVGDASTSAIELALVNYLNIINDVKSRFNGKLLMYINPLLYSETFRNKIDMIALYSVTGQLTAEQNSKLTVESYKTFIQDNLYKTQGMQYWISLGKPLVIPFEIQSRANALTEPGYVEETGCTESIGSISYSSVCIQKQQKPDFSIQAIVFQATLEAINEVSWPAGSIVMPQQYWQTDVMNPYTAYPNIASSFRNKPAEQIIKAWYKK